MTRPDLHKLADLVVDEASFVVFLDALAEDHKDQVAEERTHPGSPYGASANGWENCSIEAFLEAASEWATSSTSGMPHYSKPQNPWQRCAHILHAGKFYE